MRVAIIGASSLGICAQAIAKRSTSMSVYGFYDDARQKIAGNNMDVIGRVEEVPDDWGRGIFDALIVAVGNNRERERITCFLISKCPGVLMPPLVDPAAVLLGDCQPGAGSIVFPGAVISPGGRVGRNVIIGANATVGASVVLADYVNVAPGANIGSECSIGRGAHLGLGSSVLQLLSIGARSVVGAASVVLQDVPDDLIVCGSPAKIRKNG